MIRPATHRTALLLAVVVVVCAGCGGGGESSETLSTSDAAKQYEELVGPFNSALSDLHDALSSTPLDLEATGSAADRYVAAAQDLRSGLEHQAWPDQVADDVGDLSTALKRMISAGQSLADDSTVDELSADLQELADSVDQGTAPAGVIRTKLGLEDASTLS